MNRLAKTPFAVKWQRGIGTDLKMYEHGLGLARGAGSNNGCKPGEQPAWLKDVKRGTIKGWSKASRDRLRQALMQSFVPGAGVIGLTLTVPWGDRQPAPEKLDGYCARFSVEFKRFRANFQNYFPHSSIIYRVELQRRKTPHIHAVCYLSFTDAPQAQTKELQFFAMVVQVKELWYRAVDCDDIKMYEKFRQHGVDWDDLSRKDSDALYRYLCDHASKKKQAQMGYPGRQWGIIGKDNLVQEDGDQIPPFDNDRQRAIFWRTLARVNCYTEKCKCVFGRRYRPNKSKTKVIFIRHGRQTVQRILDYAKTLDLEKKQEERKNIKIY